MQYMILRRADRHTEAARLPGNEMRLLFAALKPSRNAVRLTLDHGKATLLEGPFPEPAEMIAGFAVVDVPNKDEAVAWLKRWPVTDQPVELEIRESGCPGGCANIDAVDDPNAPGKRFAILLRSSPDLEHEVPVPEERLRTLDAHNAVQAQAGVLLAGDGLRTSARGARVTISKQAFTVVDGPFTEIKEMIAGFWLIRVLTMQDAIAWATRNPYPSGPRVEVEIRELESAADQGAGLPPDVEEAEQRIRAEQLEAGMRAHFTA
ncbi:MAG: YciI family protein [Massilia sp.]